MTSLPEFIQSLPKTETHLHVEGALPYELLQAWQPEKYLANPYFHSVDFRYPSFPEFDKILLGHALPWFVSAERYHEAAKKIFEKHVAQNVRYVETSFHLPVTQFIDVPGPEIIAAIRSAVPRGLEVRIFAGMARGDYKGAMETVIDDLENWDDLAGVDLHGFEQVPTEDWSAKVWRRIRDAGKVTKCHAGEFDGAHRVREAIDILGVTRIQHGIRAMEDSDVVEFASERGVTFDVCPISNVRLCVVPDIASHPLRQFLAAGINCTISTDDPLVFANTLMDEYAILSEEGGFSKAELGQLAKNGWSVADVSEKFKGEQLSEIESLLSDEE